MRKYCITIPRSRPASRRLIEPLNVAMHPLYDLLERLDGAKVAYALSRHRPGYVTVTATFVGERTEFDVSDTGEIEVSRFPGSEEVVGDASLAFSLIAKVRAENEADV